MKLTIGMASFNNMTEVWFTVQALRLQLIHHKLTDVEILIVDNFGDDRLQAWATTLGQPQCRYIRYTEKQGTSAPRDKVFEEGTGEWIFCIDSHILFKVDGIPRLIEWLDAHPDCMDLIQAPMMLDNLTECADAFNDKWSNNMWGTWRNSGYIPGKEPYEIPMQGLGLFGCRKDAWLGFNPDFKGFGGEEGYIHEKYRLAGRKTISLPFLPWVHLFFEWGEPKKYSAAYEDRIRNYVIGFQELGKDLQPVIDHFGEQRVLSHVTKTVIGGKPMLEILAAKYGALDVTDRIKALAQNGALQIRVGNHHFGQDPHPGQVKTLTLSYRQDGETKTKEIREGEYVCLPESIKDRLGIFYTNNRIPKITDVVMQKLRQCQNKVDIVTCSWEPIEGNTFPEIRAMTQHSHHLNIILQILQLLYFAQGVGRYKYVSFLEHDVLYPPEYFDYPEFDAPAIVNETYKGVCPTGFQTIDRNQCPLHQMTMRFDQAIPHFEGLVKRALVEGQVMLEYNEGRGVVIWDSKHPPIHVNHGNNFTSHCTLYSQETHEVDPYWGDFRKLGLFE